MKTMQSESEVGFVGQLKGGADWAHLWLGMGCPDDRGQHTNISIWLESVLSRYLNELEPTVKNNTNMPYFIF